MDERQTEAHSRTGRIQEQYRRRFVGTSAPQAVLDMDLRTLMRESAFSVTLRTCGLNERWLSMWTFRNLVEGVVEGVTL